MIHIYHGEGKGKSTAAFGLAVRACGNDYRVVIAQFLKSRSSGELNVLSKIDNATILLADIDDVFSWQMTETQKFNTILQQNMLFEKAISCCKSGNNMIVFDEIICAIYENLIDSKNIFKFLNEYREKIEIVLTGRYPSDELLQLGDYVTEMKKIRHPYDIGVKMRKGIEY